MEHHSGSIRSLELTKIDGSPVILAFNTAAALCWEISPVNYAFPIHYPAIESALETIDAYAKERNFISPFASGKIASPYADFSFPKLFIPSDVLKANKLDRSEIRTGGLGHLYDGAVFRLASVHNGSCGEGSIIKMPAIVAIDHKVNSGASLHLDFNTATQNVLRVTQTPLEIAEALASGEAVVRLHCANSFLAACKANTDKLATSCLLPEARKNLDALSEFLPHKELK